MKSSFKITCEGEEVSYNVIKFPGGEVNVTIDEEYLCNERVYVSAWLLDSDGIIALAQIKSILNRSSSDICLDLIYTPYARQDRVCNKGESLAIKVFANLINSMNFQEVCLIDPHSDVSPAVFDNCNCTISKSDLLWCMSGSLGNIDAFVAPDAGATKEVEKLAREFNKEFIQGMKQRDTKTGKLTGFTYYGDVKGKRLLIVDDLCDGGGTFKGLANELAFGEPEDIQLYVTHGMFTNGLEGFDSYFSKIYTTNSFIRDLEDSDLVKVIYKL